MVVVHSVSRRFEWLVSSLSTTLKTDYERCRDLYLLSVKKSRRTALWVACVTVTVLVVSAWWASVLLYPLHCLLGTTTWLAHYLLGLPNDNNNDKQHCQHAVIPRSTSALPCIGDTLSYQTHSERFLQQGFHQHGPIFQTALDFSGWYLLARKVICLDDWPTGSDGVGGGGGGGGGRPHRGRLRLLGLRGFYGSSRRIARLLPALAHLVLDDRDNMLAYENLAKPIIRRFLSRLVYEPVFSFADKANELACEIVSSIFLGMKGLSLTLLREMEGYLDASQSEMVHAIDSHRQSLLQVLALVLGQQERQQVVGEDEEEEEVVVTGPGLPDLQQAIDTLVVTEEEEEEEERVEADKLDLLFLFLFEFLYPTLLQELRVCLARIVVPTTSQQVSEHYLNYLTARQGRQYVTGKGLRPFSWAVFLTQTFAQLDEQEEEEEEEQLEEEEGQEEEEQQEEEEVAVGEGSKTMSWGEWLSSFFQSRSSDHPSDVFVHTYLDKAEEEEDQQVAAAAAAQHLPVSPTRSFTFADVYTPKEEACREATDLISRSSRRSSSSRRRSSLSSLRSQASTGGARLQRERLQALAHGYAQTVAQVALNSQETAARCAPTLSLHCSIYLCEKGFEISPSEIATTETTTTATRSTDLLKPFLIEEGDLLLVRHHPEHIIGGGGGGGGGVLTGLFSQLVLSILVHELITNYQWIVLPLHYDNNNCNNNNNKSYSCSQLQHQHQHVRYPFIVPNGSVKVKDFRSIHAISFLMPSWREEPHEDDEDDEEDERYFSDGL